MRKLTMYRSTDGEVFLTAVECLYHEYRRIRKELSIRANLLSHWNGVNSYQRIRELVDELEDIQNEIIRQREGGHI